MSTLRIYILTGYLSIAVGIIATLSIYKMQWLRYGIGVAIFGIVLALTNIFLNEKYQYENEKFPKGYLGMFVSSLPVIFMLLFIFRFGRR